MFPLSILIAVMSFVFGTCIGSFLNVVIHRMPEGQSIVSPPSHCPACNHAIPFYFNLPIISFLMLKGQCAFCNAPISIRYPLVELVTGLLALGLFFKFGLTQAAFFYFIFGAVLIAISFIDLDHQIIPDKLSLPGIIVFSTSCLFVPQMRFDSVIWGVLAGGGILYLVALFYYYFRKRQGMGGGDIKLLAMIGAATGVKGVFHTVYRFRIWNPWWSSGHGDDRKIRKKAGQNSLWPVSFPGRNSLRFLGGAHHSVVYQFS